MADSAFDNIPTEDLITSAFDNFSNEVREASRTDDEIAYQAATVTSKLTGEDRDELYTRNKQLVSIFGQDKVKEEATLASDDSFRASAEAAAQERLISGDLLGVQEDLKFLSDPSITSFEDSTAALLASDSISPSKVASVASQMKVRATYSKIIERLEAKSGFWSVVGDIFNEFIPAHDNRALNNTIERVLQSTEELGFIFQDVENLNEVRDVFYSLESLEQEQFLLSLEEIALEESGVFGENATEALRFFRLIMEGDAEDVANANFWAGFDVAASVPLITLGKLALSIKGASSVKVAAQLKNTKEAVETIAKKIVTDEKVTSETSEELIEYALKTGKSPFTQEGQVLQDASEELKKALARQASSREVSEILEVTGHTGVDENTLIQLIEKYTDGFKNSQVKHIRHVNVIEADDLGIKLETLMHDPSIEAPFKTAKAAEKYAKKNGIVGKVVPEEDGFLFRAEDSHKWTIDDVGTYDTNVKSAVNWLPNWLQFPLQSLDPAAVTTRVMGIKKEDAMRRNFVKLYDAAFKGMKHADEARVYEVLAKGDAFSALGGQGKVFNPQELAAYGLATAKQQAAYYQVRTLRDLAWVTHNKANRETLEFLGFNGFEFAGSESLDRFSSAAKVMTVDESKKFASGQVKKYAFNSENGQIVQLTEELLDDLYEKGLRLVRMANSHKMGGTDNNLLLVAEGNHKVNQLNIVIPYRAGEFSRQYNDPWFVYFTADGFKDGVRDKFTKTFMTSPSKREAQKYISAHNNAMKIIREAEKKGSIAGIAKSSDAYMETLAREISDEVAEWGSARSLVDQVMSGDIPLTSNFGLKFDREVASSVASKETMEALATHGRLFTGKRSEALRRITGEPSPIKSVKESLANELSYVSKYINMAKWRESQIQKLMNTFKGRLKGADGDSKYMIALRGEQVGEWTTAETSYLRRLRAHIQTQIGIPTDEAIFARAKLKDFASWIEGKGKLGESAAYKLYDWRSVEPSQSLRAAVFHSYLGLGNLSQLLVQANGLAISASIHPIYGLKAASTYPLVRIGILLDSLNNQSALKEMAKRMDFTTLGITNEKEFFDLIKLVRKSSVLADIKSSALYFTKEGAIDLGVDDALYSRGFSAISKAGKNALNLGLIPFNRGEEMSRIVSLDIARRVWMKANPGKSILSRNAVNEILAKQEVFTLGMSRANIGRIQQGWLATPFQFAQYNWKLMETLLGKGLTGKEKARLMVGMSLLYGAEGMGASWIFDEVFGSDGSNLSKEEKIAYTQGMLSWGLYKATGAETALGARIGPGGYFEDLFSNIFDGDIAVWEFLAGPSSSFLTKEWEAGKDILRIFASTDSLDFETSRQAFFTLMEGASTGWSNTTKYLMALNGDGWLRTKSGVRNAPVSDLEAILGIFGFKSLKEFETSKGFRVMADLKKEKKELAKTYSTLINRYSLAKSDNERESLYQQIQAFRHSLPRGLFYDIHRQAWGSVQRESFFDYYKRQVTEAVAAKQTNTIRITE